MCKLDNWEGKMLHVVKRREYKDLYFVRYWQSIQNSALIKVAWTYPLNLIMPIEFLSFEAHCVNMKLLWMHGIGGFQIAHM